MSSIKTKKVSLEDRFKIVFKNIPIPIYTWQKNKKDLILIDYNFAAEKITKGQIKNFLGINASIFFKESPEILKNLYRCINEQVNISKEIEYFMKIIGEKRFLRFKYIFIPPDLVLVHTEDLTEIKQIKKKNNKLNQELEQKFEERIKELKQSEEKYRRIIENAQQAYVEIDLNGNFTFFNEALCKMLGYSSEELIGMNYKSFLVERYHKKILKIFDNIYNTGEIHKSFQYEVIRKDGKKLYGESSVYLRYDSNGKKIGFGGFMRDVTEQRETEEKLKESEELFRNIAEQSFLGIAIIQSNHFQYANEAMAKILEYSLDDLMNRTKESNITKIIHPEDVLRFRKQQNVKKGEELNVKPYISYKIFSRSGRAKYIDQYSTMTSYRGKKAEVISIMDITEKKEAEKELVRLSKIKSELLRRASHELKTPLVSIKGNTDLLLKLHYDTLDSDVILIIDDIKQGCERLEDLINDLLKSSKLESGQIQLNPSMEDLNFLIKFCVKELDGLIKTRNQKILLKLHDKLITKFEKEKIYEVIINLLSNAIKYTPLYGNIIIKSETKENFCVVSVEDNGIGITKEEKKQIFKKFGKIERYGQGWNIGIEGTGLGLYISKKIVELHGGKIWVESEGRNKGSTFYFSLPITKNESN